MWRPVANDGKAVWKLAGQFPTTLTEKFAVSLPSPKCRLRLAAAPLVVTSIVLSSQQSWGQTALASFAGKTVTIAVGFGTGGGYDIYARLVAAHLGNHLPGKPNVVVQNVPGAASVKAAMLVYNKAPKDGTTLGLFLSALTVNGVLNGAEQHSPEKFTWIGRVNDSATLGISWHTAPAQTIAQAKEREMIMASTGASGNSAMVPWALNSLAGTKFKVVPGYTASANMALALEQGEVHGIGAVSLEYITTLKSDWLENKKINLMYSIDLKRKKSLPDVPAIVELIEDGDARNVLALLGSASAIGYSFAAPPGVGPDIARALDEAFAETMKDPAFLADAARRKLDIEPLRGPEVQKIVADAVATAPAVVEMAKRATARPN
jgi:tripartite-type tricarboxylate transporter receptor subunit TctC